MRSIVGVKQGKDLKSKGLSGKLGKMEERRETSWCELEERLGAGEMKRNGGD